MFFLIDLSNKSYGFSALFPLRENLRVSGGGATGISGNLTGKGGFGLRVKISEIGSRNYG